jgi:TonB family protein
LTRAPRLKKTVEPRYPESARASSRTATVTLALDLDAHGKVVRAAVSGPPDPEFDAPAIEAALRLEFEPAEVDGKPAPVRLLYRFRFTLAVAAPPGLRGRVVERGTGAPAAGLSVEVGGPSRRAVTDPQGAFEIPDLPAGVYGVRLSGPRWITTAVEQTVPSGPVSYAIDVKPSRRESGADELIVIRAPRVRREPGEVGLDVDQARRVPGVSGDAVAVVQNLPGVARASAGSGAVVVWGSAPSETRVLIDDVPVPTLYHRGGLRSVIHDRLVISVTLVPGGFGPEHGRAIGGLVRVETSPLPRSGVHGVGTADFIDSSAAVTTRADTVAAGGAGRVGYLDRLLSQADDDIEQVVPLSSYWDYVAKSVIGPPDARTHVSAFGASDDVDRLLGSADPSVRRGERSASSFHRVAVRHDRSLPADGAASVTLWGGRDRAALDATFGDLGTSLHSNVQRFGLRATRRQKAGRTAALSLGVDVEASRSSFERGGTVSLPAREGDVVVFGQPPGDQVAFDDWRVTQIGAAAFGQVLVKPGSGALRVSPGVRVEPQVTMGNRLVPPAAGGVDTGYSHVDLAVDPRFAVELDALPSLTLRAAGGLYHQPADPADFSAVFGSTDLAGPGAVHAVSGAAWRATRTFSAEVAAFYKRATHLTARSSSPSPPVARALDDSGQGRSYGAQITLRQGPWQRVSGWVSYSLIRSERRDRPSVAWRRFDLDQTHSLVTVAAFQLSKRWETGARLRVSTGYPRTPVVGAYYEARSDRFHPVFGEQNSERLPLFAQLDLRAEYTREVGSARLSGYLEVLNVTNRENPEEVVYSHDFSERDYLTGLPVVAVLGLRGEY